MLDPDCMQFGGFTYASFDRMDALKCEFGLSTLGSWIGAWVRRVSFSLGLAFFRDRYSCLLLASKSISTMSCRR